MYMYLKNAVVATTIVHHSALLRKILVATFAFPHDYQQDKPENHHHRTLPHPEIHTVSKDSDNAIGPCTHAQKVPAIAATTKNAREHAFFVIFGSVLFCTAECCADLRIIIVVFEGQFFLKNGARHRTSVDEKKNLMRHHTIFCSYCRYYSRYYYRMMTVVTTVATRHGVVIMV